MLSALLRCASNVRPLHRLSSNLASARRLTFRPSAQAHAIMAASADVEREVIRIPAPFQLSEGEARVFDLLLDVLRTAGLGTTMRVAGGWVRDRLLGRTSSDIDIALDNIKGQTFAEHVQRHLTAVGAETHSIGTIKANPDQSKHLETATMLVLGQWIDFVNLRSETYAVDSRIPNSTFGSALQDALRRDLTINALFYNINESCIEDFTGRGLADLRDGIIRTPLEPLQTYLDDPLRVLRTVRFTARFGYALAPELPPAICNATVHEALLGKVSRERIGIEVNGMLSGPAPLAALALLARFQLDRIAFEPRGDEAPDEFTIAELGLPAIAHAEPLHCAWLLRDALAALKAQLGVVHREDTQTVIFLAAYLLPRMFMRLRETPTSQRLISGASYVAKVALKLKHKDAELIDKLHLAAAHFARLLRAGPDAFTRLAIGRVLRLGCDEHWDLALALAVVAEVVTTAQPCVAAPALDEALSALTEPFPLGDAGAAVFRRGLQVAELVDGLGLAGVWSEKPLVGGAEVQRALNIRGPAVGEWKNRAIDYQLEHPAASAAEVTAWLVQLHEAQTRAQ